MMISRKQKQLEEQQRQDKHCRRICRKRFNDEIIDEPISDPNKDPTTTADRRTYNSRNNHNLRHNSLSCKNCRKAFYSEKSFHEHTRRCSVVDARNEEDDPNDLSRLLSPSSYYKGKRTRRNGTYIGNASPPPHFLTKEEEAANYLVMFSLARDEPNLFNTDREECVASISKEIGYGFPTTPLPQQKPQVSTSNATISQRRFECKYCKKVFTSYQALGGHCASHKKVKGCFAAHSKGKSHRIKNVLMEDEHNNIDHKINRIDSSLKHMAPSSIIPLAEYPMQQSPKKKSTVHICSICNRQFSSGQALGGHKRCHWIASKSDTASIVTTIVEPINIASPNLLIGSSCNLVNLTEPCSRTFHLENLSPPTDDHLEILLRLGMPTTMHLQPRFELKKRTEMNMGADLSHNYIEEEKASNHDLDHEAESKEVKLGELCNLHDMNVGEERLTWLQVGIGSIAD